MALDLMQLGMSGLQTTQKQLNVTGHNITNVNTPGYSRQAAEQKTNDAFWHGGNHYGTGGYIDNVSRAYDRFAARELTLTTTQLNESSENASQLSVMDEFISSNASKTVNSMNDYYDAVKSLADHPNDMGSRKAVLSTAGLVASTLNSASENLDDMHKSVSDQLGASVTRVNTIGQEIATLNARILENPNVENNDLYDKQQTLINELAQYGNVTVLENKGNPAFTVMIGGGHALVSGIESAKLTVTSGNPDPRQTQVGIENGNTTKPIDSESLGGKLGTLMTFRDNVVDQARDEIGRMALGFSSQINDMQRQGLDLEGNQGKNLFTDVNDPKIQKQRVFAPVGSTADISVAIDNVSELKATEYRLKTEVATTGGNTTYSYSLYNSDDELVAQPGASTSEAQKIEVDGMVIDITKAAQPDETVLIRPVRSAASDIALATDKPNALAAQRYVTEGENNTGNATVEAVAGSGIKGTYQVKISDDGSKLSVMDAAGAAVDLKDADGKTVAALDYPLGDNLIRFDDGSANGTAALKINRSAEAKDSYTVQLGMRPAEGDNSNLINIQKVQTDKTMNDGRSSVIDLFEGLTSDIGIQKMNAEKFSQISQLDFDAATERVTGLSGVNLDEEAANLMKFQQAYMASSRIMTVAQETFDTLMRAV